MAIVTFVAIVPLCSSWPGIVAGVAALVNSEDGTLVSETCYAFADLLIGTKEAKTATQTPTRMVEMYGVRKRE